MFNGVFYSLGVCLFFCCLLFFCLWVLFFVVSVNLFDGLMFFFPLMDILLLWLYYLIECPCFLLVLFWLFLLWF